MIDFQALRNKILDKAIRGELVPQLESEPEVDQIGGLPRSFPFMLPTKWKWVKLAEVTSCIAGQSPDGSFINENIGTEFHQGKQFFTSKELGFSRKKTTLITKEVGGDETAVVLSVRAPVGDVNIVRRKICIGRGLFGIIPKENVNVEYLFFAMNALSNFLRKQSSGTTFKAIKGKTVRELHFPLAPLSEQYRIVAKINHLFEQIDRVEKAYCELSGPLSDRFRQLCLEKAIQGKLVPQLESEPIVTQVGAKPQDVPFIIPNKWKWVQLKTVGKVIGGGTPRTNVPEYWDNGDIPWFTPADLGKITSIYVGTSARKITAKGLANSSAIRMPRNSVLFSSRAPIGYIALAEEACCTNQGCKSFVANESFIMPMWAYWVLKARTPDIVSRASGTTFKEISGRGMGDTWIPLPPIPEQNRIITRIKELFDIAKVIQ